MRRQQVYIPIGINWIIMWIDSLKKFGNDNDNFFSDVSLGQTLMVQMLWTIRKIQVSSQVLFFPRSLFWKLQQQVVPQVCPSEYGVCGYSVVSSRELSCAEAAAAACSSATVFQLHGSSHSENVSTKVKLFVCLKVNSRILVFDFVHLLFAKVRPIFTFFSRTP